MTKNEGGEREWTENEQGIIWRFILIFILQGNMYKDNITNIRLQVKNMTTQKEQLEELLKEKRLQCEDQEQILTDLRIELDEKTNETEKHKGELDQLKSMVHILSFSSHLLFFSLLFLIDSSCFLGPVLIPRNSTT